MIKQIEEIQEKVRGLGGLWYLASPYSHPDEDMRERRFESVSRVAGILYKDYKITTFCPIAHTHPIEVELVKMGGEVNGYKFWLPWDYQFFPAMTGCIVACLPGWKESKGVSLEIPKMLGEDKPVFYLDVERWFNGREWLDLLGGKHVHT